ncbi:MAG: hypothetical protein KI792_11945 [Alphaproteobacteria bacterium]|nr:hypothetical protein [Alphaproteobacteria bacterium SS10]
MSVSQQLIINRFGRWAGAIALGVAMSWSALTLDARAQEARLIPAQLGGAGAVATPTEAEAVRIRQGVEQWLLDYIPPGSPLSEVVYLEGQVVVEPVGERFAVTLPDIIVTLAEGLYLPIGVITLSLEPVTPVTYRVALRLPEPLRMVNDEGSTVGELDLGRQRLRGVFDTRLQSMVDMDYSVTDIALRMLPSMVGGVDQGEQLIDVMNLGSITVAGQMTLDEQLRASGPTVITIEEFEQKDFNGNRLFYIGRGLVESEVRSFDMVAYNNFGRKFQGLAEAFLPGPDGELPDRNTSDFLLNTLQVELQALPALVGDAAMAVTLNNVVGNDPTISTGFSFDQLIYSIVGRNFNQDVGRLQIGYEHSGFSVLPEPSGPDVTPRLASFDIEVNNIPNAELWQHITGIPKDMSLYGNQPGVNYSVEKLWHALAQASTEIVLNKGYLDSQEMDLRTTGSALFDNGADYKMVAAANVRLIGMDEMLNRVAQSSTNDPLGQAIILGLRTIQSLGEVGDPIGGRSAREYNLEVESNGRVTINRQNISSLLATLLTIPSSGDQ